MSWSSEESGNLRLKITRMSTEEAGISEKEGGNMASGHEKNFVHSDKFYGYPNDDVIDWLSAFERIARANEWCKGKCGRMVSAYLRGPAGDHFEKLPDGEKSKFNIIKKSMVNRFSPADMRRSAYSNLAGRKQGKMESVNKFASANQRLVFRSFPSAVVHEIIEMTAREHFILGLRVELMRRVTMADPKTFNDTIRVALREESLEESYAAPQKVYVVQENEKMTEIIGLLGKLLKEDEASEQSRDFNRGPRRNFNGTRTRFSREGHPVQLRIFLLSFKLLS